MKKKFILIPAIAAMCYATLTSSSGGPGGNLTVSGCSCHNPSASASNVVSVSLFTNPGLVPVTSYIAGASYFIRINGQNTSASNLPAFGFQVCAVSTASPSSSRGTLSTIANTHITTSGGVTLVEHGLPLSPFSGSGGTGTIYRRDIPWTAPAAGSGSVTLRGVVNAVNTVSGADAGDQWNNSNAVIQELAQISGPSSLCVSGNITLSNTTAGGVWSSGNTAVATVNTSGLVSGIAAGTATISYTFGGNSVTQVVTVNANPGAFSGTSILCMSGTATLSNAVGSGTWLSGNTAVATIGSSSGTWNAIAAGTSTITYAIGSCSATTTVTVNSQLPNTGTASICIGGSSTLSNPNSGGTWSSSNTAVGTVSAAGAVAGLTTGTTNISYILPTGCTSVTTVTVNPLPSAIGGPLAVCIGGTVQATNSQAGGTWTTSAGTGSLAIVASTGVITGSVAGTANVTYTLPGGCSATAIATINPIPTVITGTPTVCANTATTLSCTTAGGTWSSAVTAVATVVSATGVVSGVSGGTTTISYILPTGCARTTTVTVNAIGTISGSLSLCPGNGSSLSSTPAGGTWTSGTTTVATVNATSGSLAGIAAGTSNITYSVASGCRTISTATVNSTAPITGGGSICVGNSLTLANTVTGGTWLSSNTAVGTVSTSGIVAGITAGTSIITYTNPAGCQSTTVITVTPAPGAVSAAGSGTFCGSTIITASGGAGGTIYFQGTNAGGTSTATPSTSQTVTATGTYYFRVQSAAGCWGPEASVAVTINPAPTAITGIAAICIGSDALLSSSPAGGTWSSSNLSVGTVSASGTFSGIGSGTTAITYTTSAGCTTSGVITVNVAPGAVTGAGGGTFCNSATLTATGGTGGTIFFQGTTAGGTSPSTPSASQVVTATGTYYFRVRSAAGCWGPEAAISVTINPTPSAPGGSASVCAGATATYTATPTGGTWTSSDVAKGTIDASTGVLTGIAPGTTILTYNASGCTNTRTVTVVAAPAAVSVTGSGTGCGSGTVSASGGAGGTIFFQGTTSGGTSVSVPATSQSITASGTYYFRSRSAAGCWGPEGSVTVTINALPAAIGGVSALCVGATGTATNSTSGGTWASSTPAVAGIDASGLVTAVSAGTSTITYTIPATGCLVTKIITINAVPGTIGGTTALCRTATSSLTASPSGGTWASSDAATVSVGATSGTITALADGTATITYTTTGSCTRTTLVTVHPLPAPVSGGNLAFCAGTTVSLGSSTGGGTWSVNNPLVAGVASDGTVTGIAAGAVFVTYTLPTGCMATSALTVNPQPAAITGTSGACIGQNTTLSSATTGGTWSSSDPSVGTIGASSGIFGGLTTGTTTVSYVLPNGCLRTITASVNSLPDPLTGTTSTCAGSSLSFTGSPAGGTWSTSNTAIGTVDAAGNVMGIAAGTAIVTYAASSGCFTTITVTFSPAPTAGNITGSGSVCTGLTIGLSSDVAGGTWSSSDPSIASVSTSGSVTGNTAGIASISYTVNTSCGIVYSIHPVNVTTSAVSGAISGSTESCQGTTGLLTSSVLGGTWASSNTSVAGVGFSSGILAANSAGTATITYTISSSCGVATATTVVTVNALPAAITGSSSVCTNGTATLSSSGGGSWSAADPAVATIAGTGIVTGVNAGTTNITYQLPTGCYTTRAITVLPLPAPISGTLTACTGSAAIVTHSVAGGTWSSLSPGVAAVGAATGVVSALSAGNAIIRYTVPVTGCFVSAVFTGNATPANITGNTPVCEGASNPLVSSPAGGTWSATSAAIAAINPSTGVVTGANAGTTVVTYRVATGCRRLAVVTVNANPVITGSADICRGSTSTLSTLTTGSTWTSSDPSIATINTTSGVITGINAGSVTFTCNAPNGCTSNSTLNILPTPAAITGTTQVCPGTATTLNTTTIGGVWVSSNTAVANITAGAGVVNALIAGSTVISYVLPTGCVTSVVFSVNAMPSAISGTTAICESSSGTLLATPAGGTWTAASATVGLASSTGVLTGLVAGTAIVTYTLPNTCQRTAVVTINATPAAITGTTAICAGSTTVVGSATAGGSWSSTLPGIASVDGTGTMSGVSPGLAGIRYTLPSGCFTSAIVTVNALPASLTGTSTLCAGASASWGSATAGGTWASSDAAVATVTAAGIVNAVAAGTAMVTYTLPTGCIRTGSILVNPLPVVATISGTTSVCQTATTTLTASVPGGFWTTTTGRIALTSGGVATGNIVGADTVQYSVTNTCGTATAHWPMTINPLPDAGTITVSGGALCPGGVVSLSGSTLGGVWTGGTAGIATVSATGSVSGVAPGTTVVTYTITNGCGTDAATLLLTVHTPADAGSIFGENSICETDSSALVSTGNLGGIWLSSAPAIVSVRPNGMMTGNSAGTATVWYIVPSPCGADTASWSVTVKPASACITRTAIVRKTAIQIFPNPSRGNFMIETPMDGIVHILSVDGRLTHEATLAAGTTEINLSQANMAAGVYMCQVTLADGSVATQRIVITP